jgi:hypothetical protein
VLVLPVLAIDLEADLGRGRNPVALGEALAADDDRLEVDVGRRKQHALAVELARQAGEPVEDGLAAARAVGLAVAQETRQPADHRRPVAHHRDRRHPGEAERVDDPDPRRPRIEDDSRIAQPLAHDLTRCIVRSG